MEMLKISFLLLDFTLVNPNLASLLSEIFLIVEQLVILIIECRGKKRKKSEFKTQWQKKVKS